MAIFELTNIIVHLAIRYPVDGVPTWVWLWIGGMGGGILAVWASQYEDPGLRVLLIAAGVVLGAASSLMLIGRKSTW